MIDHIRADVMRALTSLAPIGNGFECGGFAFKTALSVVIKRRLKGLILNGLANSLTERFIVHGVGVRDQVL
jgi:hypothetical protein